MENKIFKKINNVLEKIITIFFIFLICIGIYVIVDVAYVYSQSSVEHIKRYKPEVISEETLRELSENAVAWLTIDDTNIDYPIMQADTNTYYLNVDPQGQYSLAGSIFMDFRNAPDFSDDYILIYGHHMASKMMFGALDDFRDESFLKAHETGTLITRNKEYTFKIVAFLVTSAESSEIFDPFSETDYEQFLKKNSIYFYPENLTSHLMALTTCKEPGSLERTILIVALDS